jgi:cyclase
VLKKRLIGVITVKDGWAVQSFGYRRHLPLGRPECLAENLDRWGADEILVLCIDRSGNKLGPDLALVRRLGGLGLSTPLTYGGGIRTADEAVAVIQAGAERICIDAALHDAPQCVRAMSAHLGAQALVAALPLCCDDGRLEWFDYRRRTATPLEKTSLSLLAEGVVSEAMLIDWRHEGHPQAFDMDLIRRFPLDGVPLIAFGGLSDAAQLRQLLGMPRVAAVAMGNFLSYGEHAIQTLKRQLTDLPLRPASYVAAY